MQCWSYSHLADGVHPALVGRELSLEGLVFLQLALQVGGVTVGLIRGHFELLVDPCADLRGSRGGPYFIQLLSVSTLSFHTDDYKCSLYFIYLSVKRDS